MSELKYRSSANIHEPMRTLHAMKHLIGCVRLSRSPSPSSRPSEVSGGRVAYNFYRAAGAKAYTAHDCQFQLVPRNYLMNTNQKRRSVLRLLAIFVLFGFLQANAADPNASVDLAKLSDAHLIAEVRQATEQKVELTQAALQKATGKVQKFAKEYLATAEAGNMRFNSMVAATGASAAEPSSPTVPDEISAVVRLRGPEFNAAYTKAMLDLSQLLVRLIEQMAERAKDTRVRSFAHEWLPNEQEQTRRLEALSQPAN